MTSLQVVTLATSLGSVESIAAVPAQMTHFELDAQERELLGIGDDLVRLSVGAEEHEDLVKDLEQALEKAFKDEHGL
jgi:cystathionine gamma-lyase